MKNTKKILFGISTCLILMIAACTPSTADDQVYEQAVHKDDIKGDPSSVHKDDITGAPGDN